MCKQFCFFTNLKIFDFSLYIYKYKCTGSHNIFFLAVDFDNINNKLRCKTIWNSKYSWMCMWLRIWYHKTENQLNFDINTVCSFVELRNLCFNVEPLNSVVIGTVLWQLVCFKDLQFFPAKNYRANIKPFLK